MGNATARNRDHNIRIHAYWSSWIVRTTATTTAARSECQQGCQSKKPERYIPSPGSRGHAQEEKKYKRDADCHHQPGDSGRGANKMWRDVRRTHS